MDELCWLMLKICGLSILIGCTLVVIALTILGTFIVIVKLIQMIREEMKK